METFALHLQENIIKNSKNFIDKNDSLGQDFLELWQ